jgi:hypothetical protein
MYTQWDLSLRMMTMSILENDHPQALHGKYKISGRHGRQKWRERPGGYVPCRRNRRALNRAHCRCAIARQQMQQSITDVFENTRKGAYSKYFVEPKYLLDRIVNTTAALPRCTPLKPWAIPSTLASPRPGCRFSGDIGRHLISFCSSGNACCDSRRDILNRS